MIPACALDAGRGLRRCAEIRLSGHELEEWGFYGGKGFGYVDRAPASSVLGAVFEPLVGVCPSDHHRLVNGRSGKGPITRDTVGAKLEVQLGDAKVDVPA